MRWCRVTPTPCTGTIDAPIAGIGAGWKFAVRDEGRHAVTHYETIEAFQQATLVKIHLETGRTHQIRGGSPHCTTRAAGIRCTGRIRHCRSSSA